MTEPLLSVENLSVTFRQGGQETQAVKHISFALNRGETLALVGESGSGKSVTALSLLRLLDPVSAHVSGDVFFAGENLAKADEETLRALRGNAAHD